MGDSNQDGLKEQEDAAQAVSPDATGGTSEKVFSQEQVAQWANLHAEAVSGKRISPLQSRISELEGQMKAGQLAGVMLGESKAKIAELEDEIDRHKAAGENVPLSVQEAVQMKVDARRRLREIEQREQSFNLERLSFSTELEDARRAKLENTVHKIASEEGIDAKTLSSFGPFASDEDARSKAKALKQLAGDRLLGDNGQRKANSFKPDTGTGGAAGRDLTVREHLRASIDAAKQRAGVLPSA